MRGPAGRRPPTRPSGSGDQGGGAPPPPAGLALFQHQRQRLDQEAEAIQRSSSLSVLSRDHHQGPEARWAAKGSDGGGVATAAPPPLCDGTNNNNNGGSGAPTTAHHYSAFDSLDFDRVWFIRVPSASLHRYNRLKGGGSRVFPAARREFLVQEAGAKISEEGAVAADGGNRQVDPAGDGGKEEEEEKEEEGGGGVRQRCLNKLFGCCVL